MCCALIHLKPNEHKQQFSGMFLYLPLVQTQGLTVSLHISIMIKSYLMCMFISHLLFYSFSFLQPLCLSLVWMSALIVGLQRAPKQ